MPGGATRGRRAASIRWQPDVESPPRRTPWPASLPPGLPWCCGNWSWRAPDGCPSLRWPSTSTWTRSGPVPCPWGQPSTMRDRLALRLGLPCPCWTRRAFAAWRGPLSEAEHVLPGHPVGLAAVDAVGDERLLADPVDVGDGEVQHQTGRQPEGDDRQEDRHDLHDHLLLRVHLGVRVAALDLALLHEAGDGDDGDQHQERRGVQQALLQGLAGALREVHAERFHLRRRGQVLVHLRGRVDPRRIEHAYEVGRLAGAVAGHGNWPDDPAGARAEVADPAGQAAEHLVEHQEDRHLHQERQTPTQRVDVVLLVELQQLLVELLPIVLVPGLDLAHLRLELLHHHHRPGALEGQRRHHDHHQQGQQDDGEGVVRRDARRRRRGSSRTA